MLDPEKKKGKSKLRELLSPSKWLEDIILGPDFWSPSWRDRIQQFVFYFFFCPIFFAKLIERLVSEGFDKVLGKLVALLKRIRRKG
jgi:hypothetical protein